MAIQKKTSDNPIKLMGYLDISYVGRDDQGHPELSGDLSWTIERRPDTSSLDINVLRANAHNMILGFLNDTIYDNKDEDKPFIMIQDNSLPVEIVMPEIDKELTDYVRETYPNCSFEFVKKTDAPMLVPKDELTASYHKMQDEIEHDIYEICDFLRSSVAENEKYSVNMKYSAGNDIDGISYHRGFDGYEYFILHMGKQDSLGMDDYKMAMNFRDCPIDLIGQVHSSIHNTCMQIKNKQEVQTRKQFAGIKR